MKSSQHYYEYTPIFKKNSMYILIVKLKGVKLFLSTWLAI